MPIINNTYFIGEIYLPHAKPSITDGITGVDANVLEFIAEYAEECLIKSLGDNLAPLLFAELDPTETNALKVGADVKWDDLVNGDVYPDPITGKDVNWKGIRYKNISTGVYNRSFLANYVYFFFEQSDFITRSNTGNVLIESENSSRLDPNIKVVKAWRKFVNQVQGEIDNAAIIVKDYGYGIDWFSGGSNVSMYKFINDINETTPDTYPDFNPKTWERINQFGI